MEELANAIPGRWVGYTIDGRKAVFSVINITKWGKVSKGGDMKVYPVRIRVVGRATVIPPFGKTIPVTFDNVAEFRFMENDFSEWEYIFSRPSVF